MAHEWDAKYKKKHGPLGLIKRTPLNDLEDEVHALQQECSYNSLYVYNSKSLVNEGLEASTRLVETFLVKAIGIFAAFVLQQFFVSIFVRWAYSKDVSGANAADAYQLRAGYATWLICLIVGSPFSLFVLKKFNFKGCRSRFLYQDFLGLWNVCIPVMLMWAFKDVVNQTVATIKNGRKTVASPDPLATFDNRPQGWLCLWYEWDGDDSAYAVWPNLRWWLADLLVGFGAVAICVVFNFLLQRYVQWKPDGLGKGFTGVRDFCQLWLKTTPVCLGIGIAFYKSTWIIYMLLPTQLITHLGDPSFGRLYVWLLMAVINLMITYGIVNTMRYVNRLKEEGRTTFGKTPVEKQTACEFFWQEPIRLLIGCLPFVFSWSWCNFMYMSVFLVFLDGGSPGGENKVPASATSEIFAQIYYAVGLTVVTIILVPKIKQSSDMLKELGGKYANSLLKSDQEDMKMELIYDEIIRKSFGIIVGWAWTEIVSTECKQDWSWTCNTATAKDIFLYVALMLLYLFLCGTVFHRYMESNRLFYRALKVHAIEQGTAAKVFAEVDADGDGQLTKTELRTFFKQNGMDQEPILAAFEAIDAKDGSSDGAVDLDEFMLALTKTLEILVETNGDLAAVRAVLLEEGLTTEERLGGGAPPTMGQDGVEMATLSKSGAERGAGPPSPTGRGVAMV